MTLLLRRSLIPILLRRMSAWDVVAICGAHIDGSTSHEFSAVVRHFDLGLPTSSRSPGQKGAAFLRRRLRNVWLPFCCRDRGAGSFQRPWASWSWAYSREGTRKRQFAEQRGGHYRLWHRGDSAGRSNGSRFRGHPLSGSSAARLQRRAAAWRSIRFTRDPFLMLPCLDTDMGLSLMFSRCFEINP